MAEARESLHQQNQSRDSEIGPQENMKIKVHQRGRVSRLTDPETGQKAYFIDVTNRNDTSRDDFGDPKGDLVSEIFRQDLDDPNYNDRYGMWQLMSILVTDKLDEGGEKRVYIGFPVTDWTNEQQPKELTQPILLQAGFIRDTVYIPFTAKLDSSNPNSTELTRELIAREVIAATNEKPAKGKEVLHQATKILAAV